MEDSMADNKKWIVMVFMGAATIEGEENLLAAAEDDLEEMASVGSGPIKGGGQLDIYVQVYADIEPRSKQDKEQGKVPRGWCGKITPDMFDSVTKDPNRQVGDLLKYFANFGETKQIAEIGPKAVEEFVHRAIGVASPEKGNGNPVEPDEVYSMLVLWGHAYDFALGRSVTRRSTSPSWQWY
jgi:hypothetical protein